MEVLRYGNDHTNDTTKQHTCFITTNYKLKRLKNFDSRLLPSGMTIKLGIFERNDFCKFFYEV